MEAVYTACGIFMLVALVAIVLGQVKLYKMNKMLKEEQK